ncbi:MAG: hypothetical protein MUE60_12150, partial [Candidatus Eisenbacteria bacterium]|nr:hypothetical protein [Candidatus Eisenbacteria bacterium]
HRDWRLFTGHFVVHFPQRIRPSQLQRMIIDGQRRFFRANRSTFFQYFPVYASSEPYIRYLEEQERGVYDASDRLREDQLASRTYGDLPDFVPITPSRRIQARETLEFVAQNVSRVKSWRMMAENFGFRRRPRGEPPFSGGLDTIQP